MYMQASLQDCCLADTDVITLEMEFSFPLQSFVKCTYTAAYNNASTARRSQAFFPTSWPCLQRRSSFTS